MKKNVTSIAVLLGLLTYSVMAAAPESESIASRLENAAQFAGTLVQKHPYLFEAPERKALDKINRRLREAIAEMEDRKDLGVLDTPEMSTWLTAPIGNLTEVLEKSNCVISIPVGPNRAQRPVVKPIELPGDTGAMLFRIEGRPGETSFFTSTADFSKRPGIIEIDNKLQGTTWALIELSNVPTERTFHQAQVNIDGKRTVTFPILVTAAKHGRFKMSVLSDDTGKPTPSMVKLVWKVNGQQREPSNALDFADQFDQQGRQTGRRPVAFPEHLAGDYWCVPEPLDMMLPSGEWEVAIRRGVEHVPIVDTFTIESGKTVEKTYRPRRWVDMRKLGWYSGDDHVHCQILSEKDARELMAWVKAEDVHVANILKMGDIERTYFQQRGFGADLRVIDEDYILVPGQECPRTDELGHTIAMNISHMIRDTEKYFLYDWFFDSVHADGGLTGYAHTNSGMFQVHRGMSMSVPKEKIDFAEILQFAYLGTDLYYDFLNLGFKLTASAGSDVPWGGTIGEVRVYAYPGRESFSADYWFEAVRKGRTFVTNGPMLEFSVDKALPGDEIKLNKNKSLRVRARTWGKAGNFVPTKLEIVRHGEVIESAASDDPGQAELNLDFKLDADSSFWIAARAEASDGSRAHTTPVYVTRDSLRFWRFDTVEQQLQQRIASLEEIEDIVEWAKALRTGGRDQRHPGLVGIWCGNADLTNPKSVDLLKEPKVDWEKSRRGNSWSAKWEGSIIAPVSGQVAFHAKADLGLMVEIDGKNIIHCKQEAAEPSGTLVMEEGEAYPITITYFHDMGEKTYFEVLWSWSGQDKAVIPNKYLFYTGRERKRLTKQFGITRINEQLALQGDELLKQVEEARQIYENLLLTYREEVKLRNSTK